MEGVVTTMAEILTGIGTVFTQIVTWVGDIIALITGEPLLMLMVVALPICGVAIGYLKRLIQL